MAKKKGPPYTDDPGCKYVVIEDPWPGDATGKSRNQVYFNRLCTWVYFMLGKAHQVEAVYSVYTRDEVIVQIPQDVDLTPILGAHPWRRFLSRGDGRDKDRVSYVFEYNYRNRGEPGNHNWLETFPTVSGDPPAHLRFPVVFPYPRASWATPKGKNCVDLALPLPPTRQPTPVPDTSGFAPYQHPPQLSARTVDNAHARPDPAQRSSSPSATGKLGKIDPYDEETNALRSLKQEPQGGKMSMKREAPDVRVKPDPGVPSVKPEPELYGPSKTFRTAVERLQQARAAGQEGAAALEDPSLDARIKSEQGAQAIKPDPYGPSKAFRGAVERLQHARALAERDPSDKSRGVGAPSVKAEPPSGPSDSLDEAQFQARDGQAGNGVRIKPEVDEQPASDTFRAAFERIRGHQATQAANPALDQATPEGRVQPEAGGETEHVTPAHARSVGCSADDPRMTPTKRVKEEDTQEHGRKRFKSETMHYAPDRSWFWR